MEEKLINFVGTGSPDTTREAVMSKICSEEISPIIHSDYIMARSSGLTISESKHALLLAQEIRTLGFEEVLARINSLTNPKNLKSTTLKRKRQRDEEPDIKKRTRF